MLPTPPIDYLIAFTICFVLGAIWAICTGYYLRHIRRKAITCHA